MELVLENTVAGVPNTTRYVYYLSACTSLVSFGQSIFQFGPSISIRARWQTHRHGTLNRSFIYRPLVFLPFPKPPLSENWIDIDINIMLSSKAQFSFAARQSLQHATVRLEHLTLHAGTDSGVGQRNDILSQAKAGSPMAMLILHGKLKAARKRDLNEFAVAVQSFLGASPADIFEIASQSLKSVPSRTKDAHVDPLEHYGNSCRLVSYALEVMALVWRMLDNSARSSTINAIAAGCRAILCLYDLSSPFDDRKLDQLSSQKLHPDNAAIVFVGCAEGFDPEGSGPVETIQLATFLWAKFTSRPDLKLEGVEYVAVFLLRAMKHCCSQRPPTMTPLFSAYSGGEEGFASSILETLRRTMEQKDGACQLGNFELLQVMGSIITWSIDLRSAEYTTYRYALLSTLR